MIRKARQLLYFLSRLEACCTWELTLQVCGGERPMLLHHRVARQLFCGREEGSAESGESHTVDCGRKSIHHHEHIHLIGKGPPAS